MTFTLTPFAPPRPVDAATPTTIPAPKATLAEPKPETMRPINRIVDPAPIGARPTMERERVAIREKAKRPLAIPAAKLCRLTLDEFRRRYFEAGCRPKRRDVTRWIEEGTAEGVILRGYKIDGRYFVQIYEADRFLAALRVNPKSEEGRAAQ